jgi:flagellar motor switch protein FliN/FliY
MSDKSDTPGKDATMTEQDDAATEIASPENNGAATEAASPENNGAATKVASPENIDAATEIASPENIEGPAATGEAGGDRDLDFVLDIPLEVSVELGRTRIIINDLLQLGQGSIVELTKPAGEPMEIYVNGKLFARGEAVVVSEKFGVRLTDIISPAERIKTLG